MDQLIDGGEKKIQEEEEKLEALGKKIAIHQQLYANIADELKNLKLQRDEAKEKIKKAKETINKIKSEKDQAVAECHRIDSGMKTFMNDVKRSIDDLMAEESAEMTSK